MLKFILLLKYNLFFFPLLFFLSHVFALFNVKVRKGVKGRYLTQKRAEEYMSGVSDNETIILFHCASMGEFEHIKPFIRTLKKLNEQIKIVVMFFSPSGYENVRAFKGVDLFIYSPFDWWFPVRRFFKLLKPKAIIFAKHDVWPNLVWESKREKIPSFLINASLHDTSSRLRGLNRFIHQVIYSDLTKVISISDRDGENYKKLARETKIFVAGDTKYDQVLFRVLESKEKVVLPTKIYEGKTVLVAGSTWPEDLENLVPALKNLFDKVKYFFVIICPHEPTPSHIQQIQENLLPINSILYSNVDNYKNESIIVIDAIGLLATIYSIAQIAYVGGGFKQNVHNVLEPAAYGVPVLFGPVNRNSHEAQILKEEGAGIEVDSPIVIERTLEKLIENKKYRKEVGEKAENIVKQNAGATTRTLNVILPYLKENY
jgi:3-deoxy-D-manno-octulosonic-acid transferase